MDIKAKIEELVNKIKGDKNLLARFKDEPVKVIEELIGVDLPDDPTRKVVLHGDNENLQGDGCGLVDTLLNDPHSDVGVRHLLRFAGVFCLKSASREGRRGSKVKAHNNFLKRNKTQIENVCSFNHIAASLIPCHYSTKPEHVHMSEE